jgi:phospholipid/cholesterol/gamma-HCH transport system substrate-binding protein
VIRTRLLALVIGAAATASACSVLPIAGGPCPGTKLIAKFEQVGDLVIAANVQSSDVEIGRVTGIDLDKENWQANVTMCLDEGERIPADVQVVSRRTSLLGEKFIDIRPQSEGPPYLEDGEVIPVENTSEAAELEDVFTKLAAVLGAGNLEQINRFTTAQANILRDNTEELKLVLEKLRRFTGTLVSRKDDIAGSIDSLDTVSRTILADSDVLQRFLRSFAESSQVLADQRDSLQSLLLSLDRFTSISVQLLNQTEGSLDDQFRDLRPVLRTVVANSRNVVRTLRTLATFTDWFPETMPGDYLQLDVCQAEPESFDQGTNCPQSVRNDDPDTVASERPGSSLELILHAPLRGEV